MSAVAKVKSPLWTRDEAAKYLRMSRMSVVRNVEPCVPVIRIGAKRLFTKEALDAWLAEHPPLWLHEDAAKFWTREQAAAYLRMSKASLIRHVEPRVDAVRIGTKTYFTKKMLDAWLASEARAAKNQRRPRAAPRCSRCGSTGHTRRTCKVPQNEGGGT